MAPRKILTVDDDAEMRDMLAAVLEGQGYQVQAVRSGEAALEHLASHLPDLVLLDVMLPSLTGWDVLSQIRANHPTLPVIMLTGRGETVDRVVGLELGADDYVVKPFNPRELLARIGAVLRRARRGETPVADDTPAPVPPPDAAPGSRATPARRQPSSRSRRSI